MKLDGEQIVKVLENAVRLSKFHSYMTPKLSYEELRDALALIRELTEENERLIAESAKEFTCAFAYPNKVADCPLPDEVAKAKADTVREMQERLKHQIELLEYNVKIQRKTVSVDTLLEQGNWLLHEVVPDALDQIAKELLEEGK